MLHYVNSIHISVQTQLLQGNGTREMSKQLDPIDLPSTQGIGQRNHNIIFKIMNCSVCLSAHKTAGHGENCDTLLSVQKSSEIQGTVYAEKAGL